ncbi:MAG: hypothetical protein IJU00_13835, partial [Selenomonas sp.]|nr:hypothetical protein [Selenomonas sp.]
MKKIALLLMTLVLLGAGALLGYKSARQDALWQIGNQLGMVSENDGRILVQGEGELAETSLKDVEKAADAFNPFLQEQLG